MALETSIISVAARAVSVCRVVPQPRTGTSQVIVIRDRQAIAPSGNRSLRIGRQAPAGTSIAGPAPLCGKKLAGRKVKKKTGEIAPSAVGGQAQLADFRRERLALTKTGLRLR